MSQLKRVIKIIMQSTFQTAIVLLGITFISFALLHFSPGNPAEIWLFGTDGNVGQVSDSVVKEQEEKFGLDKHFIVQYGNWLMKAFQGDLGNSMTSGRPVVDELIEKMWPTIILSVISLVFTLLISIPLGVLCAVYKDRLLDNIVRGFSFVGISIPSFFSSLLLLYVLSIKFGLFPVIAEPGYKGLIMPVIVLVFQCSAKLTRQVRAVILEQLDEEYVRGALARGVRRSRILFRHVLRNALLPITTWIGIYFGILLGGAAIVESIFSWQGMGKLAVDAVARRDYFLIQGFVLWMAIIYLIVNFIVDLSYAVIDPRVRIKKEG